MQSFACHVCERGRQGHTTTVCVQTHTNFITVSVTQLYSVLGLELMVKLRTLLTFFTLVLKAEAHNYGKGSYISDMACGVRPIQGCPNYGPQAICGPRSFLWRPANDLKNNTNLALNMEK